MKNWKGKVLCWSLVCGLGVIGLSAAHSSSALAARSAQAARDDGDDDRDDRPADIHKIKHIIIIMQENRSFDTYFGTYPGADGIPEARMANLRYACPNPATGVCDQPFHDRNDENGGGPHGASNATADIDGGKMDGFIAQAEAGQKGCLES